MHFILCVWRWNRENTSLPDNVYQTQFNAKSRDASVHSTPWSRPAAASRLTPPLPRLFCTTTGSTTLPSSGCSCPTHSAQHSSSCTRFACHWAHCTGASWHGGANRPIAARDSAGASWIRHQVRVKMEMDHGRRRQKQHNIISRSTTYYTSAGA